MDHAIQLEGTCLANLNDDLVICNGTQWVHDSVHFSQDGICRLQDGALILIQNLHECFVGCVYVLELQLDRPLGAEVSVTWKDRAFCDVFQQQDLPALLPPITMTFGSSRSEVDTNAFTP